MGKMTAIYRDTAEI